jgi:hypothetical protein
VVSVRQQIDGNRVHETVEFENQSVLEFSGVVTHATCSAGSCVYSIEYTDGVSDDQFTVQYRQTRAGGFRNVEVVGTSEYIVYELDMSSSRQ